MWTSFCYESLRNILWWCLTLRHWHLWVELCVYSLYEHGCGLNPVVMVMWSKIAILVLCFWSLSHILVFASRPPVCSWFCATSCSSFELESYWLNDWPLCVSLMMALTMAGSSASSFCRQFQALGFEILFLVLIWFFRFWFRLLAVCHWEATDNKLFTFNTHLYASFTSMMHNLFDCRLCNVVTKSPWAQCDGLSRWKNSTCIVFVHFYHQTLCCVPAWNLR